MRQILNAIFKVVIDSELSTTEALEELEQNSNYEILSTDNVTVVNTEWLETTYISSEDQDEGIQITSEYAKSMLGFEDSIECLCGPDVMRDSFWPCDENGKVLNLDIHTGRYYTLCSNCGRIFDSKTLRVIGRRNVDNIDDELENA